METNAPNNIIYCAVIKNAQADMLGAIRLWDNIKIAYDDARIWLTNLDYAQIHSLEIKSIPYIKIYFTKENKIFPLNSKLPVANYPALLWTPIQHAIRIELPKQNNNLFSFNDSVALEIIPSELEQQAAASIVSLIELKKYLQDAPQIRLNKIKWAWLNNDLAFLIGAPLLPLPGTSFYRKYDFLIPCGYKLSLDSLQDAINENINPDSSKWIIWHTNNMYATIEKDLLQPLTRSSFYKTADKLLMR